MIKIEMLTGVGQRVETSLQETFTAYLASAFFSLRQNLDLSESRFFIIIVFLLQVIFCGSN